MGTAQENQPGCVSGFPQGAVRLGLWSSRRCLFGIPVTYPGRAFLPSRLSRGSRRVRRAAISDESLTSLTRASTRTSSSRSTTATSKTSRSSTCEKPRTTMHARV